MGKLDFVDRASFPVLSHSPYSANFPTSSHYGQHSENVYTSKLLQYFTGFTPSYKHPRPRPCSLPDPYAKHADISRGSQVPSIWYRGTPPGQRMLVSSTIHRIWRGKESVRTSLPSMSFFPSRAFLLSRMNLMLRQDTIRTLKHAHPRHTKRPGL